MTSKLSIMSAVLAGALLVDVATSVTVRAQAIAETDQAGDPSLTVDISEPDPVVGSDPDPVVMTLDGVEEPPVVVVDDFVPLLTSGGPQEMEDSGPTPVPPRNQEARNENQSSHDNFRLARRPQAKTCLLKAFKLSKSC